MEVETIVKTIDITPTWTDLVPSLVLLIKKGKTAKNIAIDELYKMAKGADLWNEHVSAEMAKDAKLQESLAELLNLED